MINTKYFKEYRLKLGFSNQQNTKNFFGAKDIVPTVDFNYIALLNSRLVEIVERTNLIVWDNIKVDDIDEFCNKNIFEVFVKLKEHKIIERLNNQGRRPEQVYFSWMRGYIVSLYFLKALSFIFKTDLSNIKIIGDDDLVNINSFKRTPTADLEISLSKFKKVRIEVQSGFQGVNDIKQHKVLEARKIWLEQSIPTIAIHFDMFNGQVAFVRLDNIEGNNINWITRQQMEGQTVFNIEQNYFVWKLTEEPLTIDELDLL
ncbi:MAG: restriction endonuclease [Epsilonproteobacteria bacterium]|nr:restriction endonuclease [Campylobacterota bacterium]